MQKAKVTVYGHRVISKPAMRDEYGIIKNGKWAEKELSIRETIDTHCIDKFPIAPASFNGKMCNDNWCSTQLVMLDFDGGITIEEVKSKFSEFNIEITFTYLTLSSTEKEKRFRVGLFLDKEVDNRELALFIIKGLHKIFSSADQNCKDLARFYLPGNIIGDVNYNPIQLSSLIEFILINLVTLDKNQTREFKKFADNQQLLLQYIRSGQISAIHNLFSDPSHPKIEVEQQKLIKNFNYELCRRNVKIFDDFCSGKWLTYNELKFIATNLNWVSGGLKFMSDTMLKYNSEGKTHYGENQFNLIKMIRNYNYQPMRLTTLDPDTQELEYFNLITAERNKRGFVDVLSSKEKVSLEYFDKLFDEKFKDVLSKQDSKIYIIESPTGSGKTEKLIDENINAVIAAPFHQLLDEFEDRMKGLSYERTPMVPTFSDPDLNDSIKYSFEIGLNANAKEIIKSIGLNKEGKYAPNDVDLANEYLARLKAVRNTARTVLTTHADAFIHEYPHNTIIFDEDPMRELIKQRTVLISDLNKLANNQNAYDKLKRIMDLINNSKPGEHTRITFNLIEKSIIIGLVEKYGAKSNIIEFFNSDGFIKDYYNPNLIHFYQLKKLPEDKKVIILSASPLHFIYKKHYGERVEIVDFPDVESKGNIIQYTSKSYSRSSMNKLSKEELSELSKFDNPITFKKQKKKLGEVPYDVHFGMTTGFDKLKGKDLTIIGTPHFNEICYELIAAAIGHVINERPKILYQRVIRKGLRYMFQTYSDQVLREIQLSLVESELIQAAGRARTLRTNATVTIFSNLPITIANKFIF